MTSCNVRGFLLLSDSDAALIRDCKGVFTRGSGGYLFFFNESFDAFQSGFIEMSSDKEYDVFLKNDDKNVEIKLGTTKYEIFPNRSFPMSFPFFSYRMPNSYLFVKTDDEVTIKIFYESTMIHMNAKAELEKKTVFDYRSTIALHSSCLYTYKETVHKPNITEICY